MEELSCNDVYANRVIGKNNCPWKNKKCPACKLGFNSKLKPVNCHGCDSYIHPKVKCMNTGVQNMQYYCKVRLPDSGTRSGSAPQNSLTRTAEGWKCSECNLCLKTSYNLRRHVNAKHPSVPISRNSDLVHEIEDFSSASRTPDHDLNVELTMNSFLKSNNLEKFACLFERENIDLKMLLDLTQEELLCMFKDLGISAWGDRHTLKRAIEELCIKDVEAPSKNFDVDANELPSENVEVRVSEPPLGNFEVDCILCNQSSQHKCMLCRILKFSMQDPTSDNEQHPIYKICDPRYV